jgi:leader peptidase (prepilin peptidase)/N-methyltransferase
VWLLAALGASVLTAVWALSRGARAVPHGPAMCVASAAAVGLAVW